MNEQRLLTVIKAPHVSEKGTLRSSQYVFKVINDATKPEIRQAIEHIFKVQVKSVRICNMKSKATRFGRTMGRHRGWKKAYVTLHEGQQIDIAS